MTSRDKKQSIIERMSLIFKHNRCVDDIDGAAGVVSVYFDMHGVRVAESNLCPGIYVRVSGLQVEKIMVR